MSKPEEQHNIEIHKNLNYWKSKPILKKIYLEFYTLIKNRLNSELSGKIVELGSGIGNLKTVVPEAICTDLFENPWLDQVENAYKLSFKNESVSNLILFDVFHHLEYPGNALKEFYRVLEKKGRVIIFDPAVSLLGFMVYGLLHHEPIGFNRKITWESVSDFNPADAGYYAAQGNASRVFYKKRYYNLLDKWDILYRKKISAIAYVASGGYSKPQMYPDSFYPFLKKLEYVFDGLPFIFATRLLVVLEKK